jgi:hypothetical protein
MCSSGALRLLTTSLRCARSITKTRTRANSTSTFSDWYRGGSRAASRPETERRRRAEDSMKGSDWYVQYSDDSDSDIRTFLSCGADIYLDRDNGDSGVSSDIGTVSAGHRVDLQADKGLFSRKGVKKLFYGLFDALLQKGDQTL